MLLCSIRFVQIQLCSISPNNRKHLGQQDDKHTTFMRWTQVIVEMCYAERGWSHTTAYTPQVIARLPAAYDRHFCDHLRSTEDMCRINCVYRTDVVRLVAISGISVVNWSHKCDQKYSSYEFSAFTCVNLSQPSVTYRNPSVTNALGTCRQGIVIIAVQRGLA